MRTTTTSSTFTIESSNTITMNTSPHSSKTMTMLTRLRQQQEPEKVVPVNTTDEDESSTIQNIFNEKKTPINTNDDSDKQEQQPDMYTPLSYDEADENQLVEFFMTIDIDASFGGFGNVIDNLSEVPLDSTRHSTKRRRLSSSGDSVSTAFSEDTFEYDGARKLGGSSRSHQDAPVE